MSETRIFPGVIPLPGVGGKPVVDADEADRKNEMRGRPERGEGSGNRGNASGLNKTDKPGQSDKPARLQQAALEERQVRSRIENRGDQKMNRLTDDVPGRDRARDITQTRNDHTDTGEHGLRLSSLIDKDGHSHNGLEYSQRSDHLFDSPGQYKHDSPLETSHTNGNQRDLLSSASDYLRGLTDGSKLAPEVRQALDGAAQTLGISFVNNLGGGNGKAVSKIIEGVLKHIERAAAQTLRDGEVIASRDAFGLPERARNSGHGALEELLGAAQLDRHFKQLERVGGGSVVQQAEELVARLLDGGFGGGSGRHVPTIGGLPPTPVEILRDLRGGAFFPEQEHYNPFPLTGRARIATEMMSLMRTLEAVERAMKNATSGLGAAHKAETEATLAAWLKGQLAGGGSESLEEILASLLPTLPGRAARTEAVRLLASLKGPVTDANGHALLSKDGKPLKLDKLIWLSTAGGIVSSSFGAEKSPTHTSPLLLYGFDAVFSVIGFDARALALPHFVAVQAQVNGSELEWVFGQQPFSEGWMRALIERLKDSAFADNNLLGEMLEEASTEGRFHAALVKGTVEEGAPVADSFNVAQLLPGASAKAAFA